MTCFFYLIDWWYIIPIIYKKRKSFVLWLSKNILKSFNNYCLLIYIFLYKIEEYTNSYIAHTICPIIVQNGVGNNDRNVLITDAIMLFKVVFAGEYSSSKYVIFSSKNENIIKSIICNTTKIETIIKSGLYNGYNANPSKIIEKINNDTNFIAFFKW